MATQIAKMVAGAKLKQVTGDIEGALGVDAESEAAHAKEADRKVERELAKKRKERERVKKEQHEQREIERQRIREKYGLSKDSKTSKSARSSESPRRQTRDPTPDSSEKKCAIS